MVTILEEYGFLIIAILAVVGLVAAAMVMSSRSNKDVITSVRNEFAEEAGEHAGGQGYGSQTVDEVENGINTTNPDNKVDVDDPTYW